MKNCPQCGQVCSDMINECTKCHYVFSAPQNSQPTGYQSTQRSGYQNAQPTGYQNVQPTGYQNAQPTGYQNAQPTGYQNAQTTGYQNAQTTGYQNAQTTGYQNVQPSGYQNVQPSGYQQPTPSSAKMGFGQAISSCFNQFAIFKGRARRSEFWYFYLFNMIVSTVLLAIGSSSDFFAVIWLLSSIVLFIPYLACSVRRLHDIGCPGTELLWVLCPIYGPIRLLIKWAEDSQPGPNVYGPCPK